MEIDVIIPLYKPGKEFFTLLDRLQNQTVPIGKIILMNTEEKYFTNLIYGTRFFEKYKNVVISHLSKQEFDHGLTRRIGVQKSQAEIFVMMTQDAIPENEYLLENLVAPFEEDWEVAVSYARQLPRENCNFIERYTRKFNYPAKSRIKSWDDLPRLGIKTYFCSNVCAAYRRDIYDYLGGFVKRTIFNEDMIYAAEAINAEYKIAYVAEAMVVHSHNYTNMQQLHRNFDLGVSQAQHPEIFDGVPSESEGKRMVRDVTRYLREKHRLGKIPYFYMQCFCKYIGYLLGKNYKKLPRHLIFALTANTEYWNKN